MADRVALLRKIHFSDVPQGYPITTRFGIRARNRFGSIGARSRRTVILVNRLFADPFVPTYVVDGTLGHELAHYAHGYGSGLPVLYPDPHRGGVVDRELEIRDLGEINRKAEEWRKAHWDAFYSARCPDIDARRAVRQAAIDTRWASFLSATGRRTAEDLENRLINLSAAFRFIDPPFDIEWLHATTRQASPSYWFSKACVVRIHGLVADPRVPIQVLDYEIGYWLARRAVGDNPMKIQYAFAVAGLSAAAEDAIQWRRRSWNAFRSRNHPMSIINV